MNLSAITLKRISISSFLLILFSVLSLGNNRLLPSETVPSSADDTIYNVVEKMPEFPGGDQALISFLNKTIRYPAEARKKNEEGKVIVRFIIDKSGKPGKAQILKGVSKSLDAEALRVVGKLPDWTPGEQNGQKVSVYQILPVTFKNLTPEEAWQPDEKTLVVIDSVKMPIGFNSNILNPEKLRSVQVLKPFPKEEKAKIMKEYGREASGGVIVINTKKDETEYALADSMAIPAGGCKEQDVLPQFPGGKPALMKFLKDSIQYPFVAQRLKTEGKVFVQFLVNKNGKISQAAINRSADYFLDKEALRVVNCMPDWIPGAKCGQKTDIWVVMPIDFKLDLPASERGWERNDKTIVLLDGKRLPAMFSLDWLNYANLTKYQVLQPSSKEVTQNLVKKYGRDAVNGVILIGSRSPSENQKTK